MDEKNKETDVSPPSSLEGGAVAYGRHGDLPEERGYHDIDVFGREEDHDVRRLTSILNPVEILTQCYENSNACKKADSRCS